MESVAIAAPITPAGGIGPQPKMKSGSSAKFSTTVPATMKSGATARPTPRIKAWNMAKENTKIRPTKDTRMNPSASA